MALSLNIPQVAPGYQPHGKSYSAVTIFLAIALLPMGLMLSQSFVVNDGYSLSRYDELFGDTRILALLGKSLGIAAGATLLAMLMGLPVATCLSRVRIPGQKIMMGCCLVPLFIPPHIQALAWTYLLGDNGHIQFFVNGVFGISLPAVNLYSPAGAAILLSFAYSPLSIIVISTGLSQIDRRAEESALLHARPLRVWCKIILPLLSPYLITAVIFVFLLAFFNYGVPSMLRVMTFPVEILTRFSAFYDEAGAAALAMPVILIAVALLVLHKKMLGDKEVVAIQGESRNYRNPAPRFNPAALLVLCGYFFTVVLLPFIALLNQAGSLQSFAAAWRTSSGEIFISLMLAATAATLCVILAYLLSRALESHMPGGRLVDLLTLAPLAFPGPLLAIGLIHLWNTPATQFIYANSAILVLAYIARFIPFAVRLILANLHQVNPGLREAACLYQANGLHRLFVIDLLLVKRGMTISWIVVFLFAMGELAATLLLIPPGLGTLSLKIYTLMHYGSGPLVAALSVILILASLTVSLLVLLVMNRNGNIKI